MVKASENPTAALAPVASPSAFVAADAVWSAVAATAPPSVIGEPVPIAAVVVMFEMAIPAAGAMETPPPDAPVWASVLMSCAALARRGRSLPVMVAPSARAAGVVSSTRVSAAGADRESVGEGKRGDLG